MLKTKTLYGIKILPNIISYAMKTIVKNNITDSFQMYFHMVLKKKN